MAYNFPVGYQPYYPYQQISPTSMPGTSQQQQGSGIIWVQGEAGAKSYLVSPNSTVPLWDSERQTIYLKSADISGMPSMRILDYTIRSEAPQGVSAAFGGNAPVEISRKDLDALQGQIDALKEELKAYKEGMVKEHGESDL